MKKELIKINSFSELRTGMKCIEKPCSKCSGEHEFMLLDTKMSVSLQHPELGERIAYVVVPTPKCCAMYHNTVMFESHVREGRIFRIVDGLEKEDSLLKRTERVLKNLTRAGK